MPPPTTESSVKMILRLSSTKPPLIHTMIKIKMTAYSPPAAMPHSQPRLAALRDASKPAIITATTQVIITMMGMVVSCNDVYVMPTAVAIKAVAVMA